MTCGPYKLIRLPASPAPGNPNLNLIRYNKQTIMITLTILITLKQCYYNNNFTYKNKLCYNNNPDYDNKRNKEKILVHYSKPNTITLEKQQARCMHVGKKNVIIVPFRNCLPGESYSNLHNDSIQAGRSLAWDHFCGIIANPCGNWCLCGHRQGIMGPVWN